MEDKKKKYLYVSGGKSICYDETTCYYNGKIVPRQPEDADVAVDIIALNMMRTRISGMASSRFGIKPLRGFFPTSAGHHQN